MTKEEIKEKIIKLVSFENIENKNLNELTYFFESNEIPYAYDIDYEFKIYFKSKLDDPYICIEFAII